MSAAVHNRSPGSPRRRHSSPRRRNPPRRERSPDLQRPYAKVKSPSRDKLQSRARSPDDARDRSPRKERPLESSRSTRHRQSRSPAREKLPPRGRSPVRAVSRSPDGGDRSRSPSPRTKRLRRVQAERERVAGEENARGGGRERHRERMEDRDGLRERNDGRSVKSTRRDRSVSPDERNWQRQHGAGSPPRDSRDGGREEVNNSKGAERSRDYGDDSISKMKAAEEALDAKQKQKPSFELSGKLAEETNRVRGVALLFNEPPDARKPDVRWRLYVFKAGEVLNEPLYLHRQSSYLFGRERRVADVPTDHPSCSKQHAVIQYRLVEKEQPDGMMKKQIRPYLMDLGSTNGTFINDNRVEAQRYYELFEKDTIRFGNSSREYVLLHENSAQ